MEEHLPSMCEALSLIVALQKMKMKEEKYHTSLLKVIALSCLFPFMPQLCNVAFKKLTRKQASEMFTGKKA